MDETKKQVDLLKKSDEIQKLLAIKDDEIFEAVILMFVAYLSLDKLKEIATSGG